MLGGAILGLIFGVWAVVVSLRRAKLVAELTRKQEAASKPDIAAMAGIRQLTQRLAGVAKTEVPKRDGPAVPAEHYISDAAKILAAETQAAETISREAWTVLQKLEEIEKQKEASMSMGAKVKRELVECLPWKPIRVERNETLARARRTAMLSLKRLARARKTEARANEARAAANQEQSHHH